MRELREPLQRTVARSSRTGPSWLLSHLSEHRSALENAR